MDIRSLLVFFAVFCLLPFCLTRPYIGVLTWAWLGYMNPHRLTWNWAYDFPFTNVVAVVTVLGIVLMTLRTGKLPKVPWARETILLVMLWGMFILTTFFAIIPDEAWPELATVSKILLPAFLTMMLIDSEKKMKYLLLVIAFSLGFYGFKGGIFSILRSGEQIVFGPGGFIADNNALGLAMNMTLPILFYLAKLESRPWIKRLLGLTFLLTIIAVIFTYSRGALLGLAVVLGLIVLSQNFAKKFAAAILLVALLPVAVMVVPDKWFGRMATIQTYEEDSSAQKRIMAWKTAWQVAINRPLVGGGFQIIDDPEAAGRYNPEFTAEHVGAHSVYFEILGENGFITFTIFVLILGTSLLSLRRIRRVSLANGQQNYYCYAKMLEISIAGYAVSGAFLELGSFDMFYQIIALVVVLKTVSREELGTVRVEDLGGDARLVYGA